MTPPIRSEYFPVKISVKSKFPVQLETLSRYCVGGVMTPPYKGCVP